MWIAVRYVVHPCLSSRCMFGVLVEIVHRMTVYLCIPDVISLLLFRTKHSEFFLTMIFSLIFCALFTSYYPRSLYSIEEELIWVLFGGAGLLYIGIREVTTQGQRQFSLCCSITRFHVCHKPLIIYYMISMAAYYYTLIIYQ